VTAVPSGRVSIAPSTGSGGTGTGLSTYLEIVAVLAGLALVAGLTGLYLTRDRKLPVLAGAEVPPVPPGPPAGGRFYSAPRADADHDWGSQTPGPPPPPPPPPPYAEEE
jgi:hypothetical protein